MTRKKIKRKKRTMEKRVGKERKRKKRISKKVPVQTHSNTFLVTFSPYFFASSYGRIPLPICVETSIVLAY
jgi:hypothetical protein